MNLPVKKAGQYNLDSFKISKFGEPSNSIEAKLLVHKWELTESMNSGHIYGSATIYDGVGLFYDFAEQGLKGEEEIEIVYRDFYENEMTHKLFLYAISDVQFQNPSNETLITYTIHFVSKDKFLTEQTMVRRGFSDGTVSEYANTIFQEYYAAENSEVKEIKIESTEGTQTLVVPNYSPEQAMAFLARKAYSAENDSQTFRFFENREKYYFSTHEELVFDVLDNEEEINLYIKVQQADQSPDGQLILMQNIINIEFPNYVNTIGDMVDGAFYRSVTELDYMNRTALRSQYQYLDDYNKYLGTGDLPGAPGPTRTVHTKEFIDENAAYLRDVLVIKDYSDAGTAPAEGRRPHTFYTDIYNKKITNIYHHTSNMVTMRVYGRNEVMAGKFVQIEILKSDGNPSARQIDEERSGMYLVESIRNVFYENEYVQVLSMSKSGITGAKEAASDYIREPQQIDTEPGIGGTGAGGGDQANESQVDANTESLPSDETEQNAWTTDDELAVEQLRAFNAELGEGSGTRAQLSEGERAYAISKGYIS